MTRTVLLLASLTLCACLPDDAVGTSAETSVSTSTSSGDLDSTSGTTHGGSSSGDRESEGGTSGEASSTSGEVTTGDDSTTSTGADTTGGVTTSASESVSGTGSTGGAEPLCWAKGCDADHPCAPGLECELHPNAVGLWVCSAPCESCATGLFFCDAAVPLGECLLGSGDMPRCFPILCPNGPADCKGGQECIDGACFG